MKEELYNGFPFIRLPKALIENPNFSYLSPEAKLLFALILDRMSVSRLNAPRFTDERGKTFVIYTINEIAEKLGCSRGKAIKTLDTLVKAQIVRKNRAGCGKPSTISVPDYVYQVLFQDS